MKPGRLGWLALALLPFGVTEARAEEPVRYPIDSENIRRLELGNPEARKLFRIAETELSRGAFEQALVALNRLVELEPKNGLVRRRRCQAYSELGRRREALADCRAATASEASPMDQRALVGALMLGPEAPTEFEVTQAFQLAALAKQRLPDQAFGYAADCDIARRLEHEAAYQRCLEDLQRVAPEHYETQRAKAGVARPEGRFAWLGWLGILGAALGTGGHAGWRRIRGGKKRVAAVAIALLSVPALVGPASADPNASEPGLPRPAIGQDGWQLSQHEIDFDDPENALPTNEQRDKNPLEFGYFLQDLAAEGQKAEDKGDLRKAVKFWRALAKAVPESNAGFFRACGAYEKLGERELAIEYCGKGISLPPEFHAREFARYASLILSKQGALTPTEIGKLDQLITHLRAAQNDAGEMMASQVECQLGLDVDDVTRLERCTTSLAKLQPKDSRTVTFQWSLAMKRGDLTAASAFVARARELEFPKESSDELERAVSLAKLERWKRRGMLGLAAAGLVVALVFLLRTARSKLRDARAGRPALPVEPPAAVSEP